MPAGRPWPPEARLDTPSGRPTIIVRLAGIWATFLTLGLASSSLLSTAAAHAGQSESEAGLLTELAVTNDETFLSQLAAGRSLADASSFERLSRLAATSALERQPRARRLLAEALLAFVDAPQRAGALSLLIQLAEPSAQAASSDDTTTDSITGANAGDAARARGTAMRALCLSGHHRAALALFGWARARESQDSVTRELATNTLKHCPRAARLVAELRNVLTEKETRAFERLVTVPAPVSIDELTSSDALKHRNGWLERVARLGERLDCHRRVTARSLRGCGPVDRSWSSPAAWRRAHMTSPEVAQLLARALLPLLERRVQKELRSWLEETSEQSERGIRGLPLAQRTTSADGSPARDRPGEARIAELDQESSWRQWSTADLWALTRRLDEESLHLAIAPLCQRLSWGPETPTEVGRWLGDPRLTIRGACLRGLGNQKSPLALGVLWKHYEVEANPLVRQVTVSALLSWSQRSSPPVNFPRALQHLATRLAYVARLDPDAGVRAIAAGRPELVPRGAPIVEEAGSPLWSLTPQGHALFRVNLGSGWATYRRPADL